jgi:hypothetical protein
VIFTVFLYLNLTFAEEPKSILVPPILANYVSDLRADIIKFKLPQKYIENFDNIMFKIVSEKDDKFFLQNALPTANIVTRLKVIALCAKQFNIIYIREQMIKTQNQEEIQQLIDHEIGHCVFNRKHLELKMTFKNVELPKSIMTSTHVTLEDPDELVLLKSRYLVYFYKYPELKEYYRKELLDPSTFNSDPN